MKLLIFALLAIISITVNGQIVTVYQSVDPIEIITQQGTATVLNFPGEIETAIVGSETSFNVQENSDKDKLIISALKSGVWTNLTVIDRNDNHYVFHLIENNDNSYYDLVNVKPKESMPYSEIVKIINNERHNIESDIAKLVDLYDVEDYSIINDDIEIYFKRAGIINNTDETAYWLRINNKTEESIRINSIGIKERELKAIVTQVDKITINDFADYFLIIRGRNVDKNFTINLKVGDKTVEFKFEDITYITKNFKVYEINQF